LIVSGVALSLPILTGDQWTLRSQKVPTPALQTTAFDSAHLTPGVKDTWGQREWPIDRQSQTQEFFTQQVGLDFKLQMIYIPGGQYQMGAQDNAGDYREQPVHTVDVPAFFLSRFLITQQQWLFISKRAKVRYELTQKPSAFNSYGGTTNTIPVSQITWFEATEFCERLYAMTGLPYRLPTEAEWEYACKAGTSTSFHFGWTISPSVANYDNRHRYRESPKRSFTHGMPTSVGAYMAPNAFGLQDMHGNVWEWCADHWYPDYTDSGTTVDARTTDLRDAERVIRGGAWDSPPDMCRSSYRMGISPYNRLFTIGLRVALSVGE
ncbi:MAG: formylglycine-generating enzyme family protein, partial [Chloroflexota bacterium]